MHLQSDICIIGNGAIGKTAALGFAQAGLSVGLLSPPGSREEPVANDDWDARVYALNHVAKDLLASLMVWDALDAARVTPVDAMQVNGDGARHAGRLGFDAYGARVDALAWIVEDRNLNQALDAALKFAPKVKQVTGLAGSMQSGDHGATVQLENGGSLGAALLVGADGGQSWVRHQCEIGFDYRSYKQRAIVTNFACEKPHHGVAHQWFSAEHGIIALLPLPGQRVSLVWSAPDLLATELLGGSLSQLAQRLAPWAEPVLGALQPLSPEVMKAFPLSLLRSHAITAPGVVLIGDAAHVVHPLAGHGMNLGFADVAALVKAVTERESGRDCGDVRILGRYARARKEEVLLMQLATDGLERLFSSNLEPLRLARNLGLNLLDKLPVIKRRLISQALG